MNYEIAYNKAIELLDRDIKLLFQRLNFFLIATAFLLAAFGAVVGDDTILRWIGLIIAVTGILFSLLFASINYLNTRIIWKIGRYVRYLEGRDFTAPVTKGQEPYNKIYKLVKTEMRSRKNLWLLVPQMFKSMITLWKKPKVAGERSVADHTYIVPFFFMFVWILLLILITIFLILSLF